MSRSAAQRVAWRALSPNKRRLLLSHYPDDMERDESIRHSVRTALINVFGPMEMSASSARIAEGEPESDRSKGSDCGMTYEAIGNVIGCSGMRVRQIEAKAMRKLRHASRVRAFFLSELLSGDVFGEAAVADIDGAIMRATVQP